MGTTHISAWAKATGAHINNGYAAEDREGGIRALGTGIANVPWADLQALPEARWQQRRRRDSPGMPGLDTPSSQMAFVAPIKSPFTRQADPDGFRN